jgi:cell division protease FtsH
MSDESRNNPPSDRGAKGPAKKGPQKFNRSPFGWLIVGLIIMSAMMMVSRMKRVETIKWSEFLDYIEAGQIESVEFQPSRARIEGKFNAEGVKTRKEKATESFAVNYDPDTIGDKFANDLKAKGIEVSYTPQDFWMPLLWNLFPIVLLVAFVYFMFLRNMRTGGGGMLMSFGRSRHKVQGKGQHVTFADVAGIEEAKEEVAETIEFLKNPKKFRKIGGRIPRGVLLVGPPGCGKTLLAKAIAGESDVPFFSISGSDFVEMFVGVGASRVRDLFKQAKENSPCIIFLDEIDAIGRKRGPGFVSGGHDEREQTLNAILVEMDGFDRSDQVIVIAATNRKDILDHALTRPGRFDRQVVVPLPDLKGRVAILKIHARNVQVGPNVDFERLARGTPMFSGAELEALINEAAISASMANKDYIEMADMEEARDKVRWGRAKKSRVIDEHDKLLTAYHEAGHAFVQATLEDADPLHKVSIIPRGPMGGATFSLPEKDRLVYTKRYCFAQLQVCFAGRIAEELFCDDISSGAQSDIKMATQIAREMVSTWGMGTELGPIDYGGDGGMDMYYPGMTRDYSEKTAELIDKEIKAIVDESYARAKKLIEANRDKLEAIARALIKYETLDAADVEAILAGGQLDKPTVADLLAMEQKRSDEAQKQDAQGDLPQQEEQVKE